MDAERQQAAEEQVKAWCADDKLPFPNFTEEFRASHSNTLDYPPKGTPEAGKTA